MPYRPFQNLFPEVAAKETRTITVFEQSGFRLPAGEYTFLELFCDESDCDCRRALFYVVSSLREDAVAVIAYGWESRDYYIKWMHDDDPLAINELKGPALNLASPQSDVANDILELFNDVLLKDTAYIERVKRHYQMFRNEIDRKMIPLTKRRTKKRKKKRKV